MKAKGSVFLAVILFSVLAGGADRAQAQCVNYENYLHWVSSMEVPGDPYDIFVLGDYAYVADRRSSAEFSSHLLVVDLTIPSQPVVVGSVDIPGDVSNVEVLGTVAAVTSENGPAGLYMVDVSIPDSPALLGSGLVGDDCTNVAISDTTVLATTAAPAAYLRLVDISDPANPVLFRSLGLPWPCSQGLEIHGGYAFMATSYAFIIVDIRNPASAVISGRKDYLTRFLSDLTVNGDYAYIVAQAGSYTTRLIVYDVHDKYNPQKVYDLDINGILWGNYEIFVAYAAGLLYAGSSTHQIWRIDVSNPAVPVVLDSLPKYRGLEILDLSVFDTNLYILRQGYGGIHSVSVASPSPFVPIGEVLTSGEAQSVVLSPAKAGLVYVADGNAGLTVVNVTDPQNPVVVGTIDTPGYARDIALDGTVAYLADGTSGLQIIDVADPGNMSILGSRETPGDATDIVKVDSLVYIADLTAGLRIIKVLDPGSPVEVGAQEALSGAYGVDVEGSYAYVADRINGLKVCNVSDPTNPWIINGTKALTDGDAQKVDVVGDQVYVSYNETGLKVFDSTVPESLSALGSLVTPNTLDVKVAGIMAFMGSASDLYIVDVSDPTQILSVGEARLPQNAKGLAVTPAYVYVAAGTAGLQVCPTQCGFDETVVADFTATPQADFFPLDVVFTNNSFGYGLSYLWDFGDGVGTSIEENPTYSYAEPGDYPVTLTVDNGKNTDVMTLIVSSLSEAPVMVSVQDVPNDQGGFVYIDFYHSGYDDGTLNKSEMYTVQREDGGKWVNLNSFGAYGEHYYTVLAMTPGDGESEWSTSFRVIANMAEGNWASAPMVGFSTDDIAPAAPQNVVWLANRVLGWDQVAATDFAYYMVFSATSPEFENAVPVGTTVATQMDLTGIDPSWVFVVAVDDAGGVSEPSSPLAVSGVPTIPQVVQFSQPVPNPFNPQTTLEYALPQSAMVQLRVFDVSGRCVRTLVNGVRPSGRHSAVWNGLDDAGRPVASGTYFGRLAVEGIVLTRRLALVK